MTAIDAKEHPEFPDVSVLIDGLQLFARFKTHGFAGWNADLGSCARVAADTGLAGTHVEHSEAAQFDAIALGQGLLHALEDGFHGHLSLRFGDARLIHDFVDDVEFDHDQLRTRLCIPNN
jgi:hypothetical protein